jgi:Tetratricopeptide repeat
MLVTSSCSDRASSPGSNNSPITRTAKLMHPVDGPPTIDAGSRHGIVRSAGGATFSDGIRRDVQGDDIRSSTLGSRSGVHNINRFEEEFGRSMKANRRSLTIGARCDSLGVLPFLPALAAEMDKTLLDPALGACTAALPDGRSLLIDPGMDEIRSALSVAFSEADRTRSTLFLSFIGHGIVRTGNLYLMPSDYVDPNEPPTHHSAVLLGQEMKNLLDRWPLIDGLILVIDACGSGAFAEEAGTSLIEPIDRANSRIEILMSADHDSAYDGCFTERLVQLIRSGMPSGGYYLRASELVNPITSTCTVQRPRWMGFSARRVLRRGDPGLWLSRNEARRALAGDLAGETYIISVALTEDYYPTTLRESIASASISARLVAVTGHAGTGKSTAIAALARSEDLGLPDFAHAFVSAVVYLRHLMSIEEVGNIVHQQLQTRVSEFAAAAAAAQAAMPVIEWERQRALDRLVTLPLRQLGSELAVGRRVRIAFDGVDQLAPATRAQLLHVVEQLTGDPDLPFLRIIFTERGHTPSLPGKGSHIEASIDPADLASYLRERQSPIEAVPQNWLQARLAVRIPEIDWTDELVSAVALSDASLLGSDEPSLAALLRVVAVLGESTFVPLAIVLRAVTALDEDTSIPMLRNLIASYEGLFIRMRPGEDSESIAFCHPSIVRLLLGTLQSEAASVREAVLTALPDPETSPHRLFIHAARAELLYGLERYQDVVSELESSVDGAPIDNAELWSGWVDRLKYSVVSNHPAMLAALGNQAYWIGETGQYFAARDMLEDLVPRVVNVFGATHREAFMARNNLAYSVGDAGDPAAAREAFATLLAHMADVLGADHRDTLSVANNHAIFVGWAGEPKLARELLSSLVRRVRTAFGPDDGDTLTTMNNLAYWAGESGDDEAARQAFSDLVPELTRVLGVDHTATLKSRHNLAVWTARTGDVPAALVELSAVVAARTETLGIDHPDTLTSRHAMLEWDPPSGALDRRGALQRLLSDRVRVLGPDHPDTEKTRQLYARVIEKS